MTPELLRVVIKRFETETAAAIARDLGVTKNSIIGALNRAGVKKRKQVQEYDPEKEEGQSMRSTTPRFNFDETRCRWPMAQYHPGDPGFHYCGKKVHPHEFYKSSTIRSYCLEHLIGAYQWGSSARRRRP